MKDFHWMLVPLLFSGITNVCQVYFVMILRMCATWLLLSLHFGLVDKDTALEKIGQKQLDRERESYLVGIILHGYVQLVLQIIFPAMFLADHELALRLVGCTIATHVMLVEPLYYVVHRWLHRPDQMKSMHGFHHSSLKTVPSTSLVQDFQEHIIYVAIFGPAMLLPYFILGYNHWLVIAGYLVIFDMLNAFGHTNIVCTHWLFHHAWSPVRYLLYTPAFHLGHHAHFNCNYSLFMPLWDHMFGTYREYTQRCPSKIPSTKQDFVFIGHNGGLGHYLTIPEVCFYNIYDTYAQTGLPIEIEFLCADLINRILRCVFTSYRLTRYLVDGEHVGRVICLMRTPLDYLLPQHHSDINAEILQLIKEQHATCGTRCFGLGNLNKMKQLNDGGIEIARMVASCLELQDKKIRIWTGDTLTVASIARQLSDVVGLQKVLYIGAAGKVGTAVCQLLAMKGAQVCVYSTGTHWTTRNPHALQYTSRIEDLTSYTHVVIGKALTAAMRSKIQRLCAASDKTHILLDYSVPFMPLQLQPQQPPGRAGSSRHVQIGVLRVRGDSFLQGYYDMCMGLDQGHIYPCHAGCLLNLVTGRETDETGPIKLEDVEPLWIVANSCGLENRELVL